MRRVVLVSLLAAGCQAGAPALEGATQPVVGAEVTTGDPAVVALVTSSGRVFCTGTLISPQIVLSAAHCLADAGGDPAVSAVFGSDARTGTRVPVNRTVTHPGWTGDLAGGNDLSLSVLGAPQDPALPVPVNRADLAGLVGAPYRVVGFGISDRATRTLDGKKRVGAMVVTGLASPDYVEVGDVDADGETAICQGDSGGPGFVTIDGVERLAGVHSYSIQGCFNPSGDARPDRHWDDFIQPFIDREDLSCRKDGVCVRTGCSADPDCEPCNADGTCTTGCALPDPDCPTAGLGEICLADTQCASGVCVAWAPDRNSRFCSRPCVGPADCPVGGMVCREVAGEGRVCDYDGEPPGVLGQACDAPTDCSAYLCLEGRCTYECDLPRGLLCPAGARCDTLDGTTYVCLVEPTDDGGCCGAARDPSGAAALALLVLARVRRPRRGRT